MTAVRRDIRSPDHEERMRQARARAEWDLGDASWASVIVGAYLYPDDDRRALELEREEQA